VPPRSIHGPILNQFCAAFYENDVDAKAALVDQVRDACLEKGFFQIIGHGVPEDLQSAMFEQSADFFSLPLEQKEKYDKGKHISSMENLRGFSDES
jgi:isopenicillin N synthase-like dioxygenase